MKRIIFSAAVAACAAALCGQLEDAVSRIGAVIDDPVTVIDEIDALDCTNVVPYIETVMKAAETYPAPPSVVSNRIEKLKLFSYIATNSSPTVILKAPASESAAAVMSFLKQNVRNPKDAGWQDPVPMLGDGHGVIIDSDTEWRSAAPDRVPVRYRREPEPSFEPQGYAGQVF